MYLKHLYPEADPTQTCGNYVLFFTNDPIFKSFDV